MGDSFEDEVEEEEEEEEDMVDLEEVTPQRSQIERKYYVTH